MPIETASCSSTRTPSPRGEIGLLLDAAGGYTLFRPTLEHIVAVGAYLPRSGGVDFIPNDGSERAVMELEGERLVDDLGVGFRRCGRTRLMVKRRKFLGGAAAVGAAGLSLPTWVSRAFAQDEEAAPSDNGLDRAAELRDLSAAYRSAQRRGRPLLVFVVPEDGGARWERAHALGELLNNGDDEAFANLAMADVVCSTMRSLRTLVPQAGQGEPWMVLVEPNQRPVVARSITLELPENPNQWTEQAREDYHQRVDQAIDQRIAMLAATLHEALARDEEAIARRARVAEQHLDAALVRRVHAAIRRGQIPAELLAAAPAVVRAGARGRASVLEQLAANARERLARAPIPGSLWATSFGCGVTVEGRDDNIMVGCGMGHVPERSRRFLYWYTSPASIYQ